MVATKTKKGGLDAIIEILGMVVLGTPEKKMSAVRREIQRLKNVQAAWAELVHLAKELFPRGSLQTIQGVSRLLESALRDYAKSHTMLGVAIRNTDQQLVQAMTADQLSSAIDYKLQLAAALGLDWRGKMHSEIDLIDEARKLASFKLNVRRALNNTGHTDDEAILRIVQSHVSVAGKLDKLLHESVRATKNHISFEELPSTISSIVEKLHALENPKQRKTGLDAVIGDLDAHTMRMQADIIELKRRVIALENHGKPLIDSSGTQADSYGGVESGLLAEWNLSRRSG